MWSALALNNVLIVDDMESYSHRWPVPDVAFLVASPKLELELKTLVRVNPKIRVVIYTLEFSLMSRIPGMLWETGIEPQRSCSWRWPRWAGRTKLKSSLPPGSSRVRRGESKVKNSWYFCEKTGTFAS